MLDPFPMAPPEALVRWTQPLANALGLPTFPLHAHEALFAFLMYTVVCCVVSPIGSRLFCPKIYNSLSRRTRVNWDVHVTSLFQSTLVSALSFYVIFYDLERKEARARQNWESRIWEYTGMSGFCQSMAFGYFVWDFIMCVWRVDIFGWGMVAHAVSALTVFSFGYRPFVDYYAPVFLLYELSSPFLNIHWFCDKLDLTGSPIQAINGAFLTATFFGCRLIWGNLSSILVFYDIFRGVRTGNRLFTGANPAGRIAYSPAELLALAQDVQGQRWAFAGEAHVPLWLAGVYLTSNLTLNSLNIFWFGKMIETIRKRFDPPFGTKGVGEDVAHWERSERSEKAAAKAKADADAAAADPKTKKRASSIISAADLAEAMQGDVAITALDHEHIRQKQQQAKTTSVQRGVTANGSKSVEVAGSRSLRTRRA